MTLDKRSVELLLKLDDAKFAMIIKKMMSDAGIDSSTLKLGEKEISGIRAALSSATDNDIARALELIQNYKSGKKSP